MSVRRGRGNMI